MLVFNKLDGARRPGQASAHHFCQAAYKQYGTDCSNSHIPISKSVCAAVQGKGKADTVVVPPLLLFTIVCYREVQ